jgi:four helix bundle protein
MRDRRRDDELESRLVRFGVRILKLASSLPRTPAGRHVCGQIIRCGTSAAPNYAEARDAESREDLIHKFKVVLKELRETRVWLLMIVAAELIRPTSLLAPLVQENNELIAIFVKSIQTAKGRRAVGTSGSRLLDCSNA